MLAEKRFAVILEVLAKRRAATVTELAQRLDTSESTVRRDLMILAEQGKLNKVHGGATAVDAMFESTEPTMSAKEQLNLDQKDMIARYAAAQVQPDDVIFLDAGSTTLRMLEYLEPSDGLLIVTNGILHAQRLVNKGFKPTFWAACSRPEPRPLWARARCRRWGTTTSPRRLSVLMASPWARATPPRTWRRPS